MDLFASSNIKKTLGFAGALPFIFCALLLFFKITSLPLLGEIKNILSVYALVITSFVSGSHWGLSLKLDKPWNIYLPTISNIIAVFLWLFFLVLPFTLLTLAFILAFLGQLYLDKELEKENLIHKNYFSLRLSITIVALISLLVSLMFS